MSSCFVLDRPGAGVVRRRSRTAPRPRPDGQHPLSSPSREFHVGEGDRRACARLHRHRLRLRHRGRPGHQRQRRRGARLAVSLLEVRDDVDRPRREGLRGRVHRCPTRSGRSLAIACRAGSSSPPPRPAGRAPARRASFSSTAPSARRRRPSPRRPCGSGPRHLRLAGRSQPDLHMLEPRDRGAALGGRDRDSHVAALVQVSALEAEHVLALGRGRRASAAATAASRSATQPFSWSSSSPAPLVRGETDDAPGRSRRTHVRLMPRRRGVDRRNVAVRRKPCTKTRYASVSDAQQAIAGMVSGSKRSSFKRPYRCGRCRAFHITSTPPIKARRKRW